VADGAIIKELLSHCQPLVLFIGIKNANKIALWRSESSNFRVTAGANMLVLGYSRGIP
jgi:hypothetical protein